MRLLALLVLGCVSAAAQISNVEMIAIEDGAVSLRFDTASGSRVRVAYGTTTSGPTDYLGYATENGTANGWAIGGLEPGTTYEIRPEYYNGSWQTGYDCSADGGLDLTPSISSTGSAACPTDTIRVTTEAAGSKVPTAPSGYPTPSIPDFSSASRTLTASTCADLRTHVIDLENDTGDGSIEVIEMPGGTSLDCVDWVATPTKTNTDDIWIISDADDGDCPPTDFSIDPAYSDCYVTLRGPVSGSIIDGTHDGLYNYRIKFARRTLDSGDWSDVAAISSVADNSTKLDVTTSAAHGITTGGDPDRILVVMCEETGATTLNGVWQYDAASGTSITLTVDDDGNNAAGKVCTNGYVVQDPEWNVSTHLVSQFTGANDYGYYQCLFEANFPTRQATMLQSRGTDWYVAHSWFDFGTWTMLVSGSADRGPQPAVSQVMEVAVKVDNASRFLIQNTKFRGMGLASVFRDSTQATTQDAFFDNVWHQMPSSRVDVDGNNGADLIDDVVVPGRHGGPELKVCQECKFDGMMCTGYPAAAFSDNTIADCLLLRAGAGDSGDMTGLGGTRDIDIDNVAAHNMPQNITLEGSKNSSVGKQTSIEGRFDLDNILGSGLTNKLETDHQMNAGNYGGRLFQIGGIVNRMSISNFTSYKPTGDEATIELGDAQMGLFTIEKGVTAGPTGQGFLKRAISLDVNPAKGTTSADQFATAARPFGTTSVIDDIVVTTGLEDGNSDVYATASDAADKVDATEADADLNGTDYDVTDYLVEGTATGTTVASDIDDLGLGSEWEYSGDGVSNGDIASGDEGVDGVALKEALGILRPYTGESDVVALARSGDTGIRFRFRMTDTSTDTYLRYREVDGAWSRQTCSAGASKDRECTLTGLTAGTRYEWWLETPSMVVRGRATPGS